MLSTTQFCRKIPQLLRITFCRKMAPLSTTTDVSVDDVSSYDRSSMENLLQDLKRNIKLSNTKTYEPPSDVESIVKNVVSDYLTARQTDVENWRSFPLKDPLIKYEVLTMLSARLDCDVPNFMLSYIETIEDALKFYSLPKNGRSADSKGMNYLEKLGEMQKDGQLPSNIHVQVEYPGRVLVNNSSQSDDIVSSEEDHRPSVYTGVDNIVTSVKYRRKYRGYTAKIKEPLV